MSLVAPDLELLPAFVRALSANGYWDADSKSHVYAENAPSNIVNESEISKWCVARVLTETPTQWRADRMDATLEVAVQSVGWKHADAAAGQTAILNTLQEKGLNDRLATASLSSTDNWNILSINWSRGISLVPNPQMGFRWYEYGYVFIVRMEDKNAYV